MIFTSHMVLQRNADIPVWGFLAPGTNVSVNLNSVFLAATTDPTGRWSVLFPAMVAGGPYVLSANSTSGAQQVLEDVLVGDVVLCSGCVLSSVAGEHYHYLVKKQTSEQTIYKPFNPPFPPFHSQSNMDMPISYAFNATAEAEAAALYPNLRYFNVNANYSSKPLREFISTSRWEAGTSASVASGFSAVCWFAVRYTYDALRASGEEGLGVGMLHSALGGTPIQAWMSSAAAAACPLAQPPMYPTYSGLYNAMIAPMVLNGMRTSHTIWWVPLVEKMCYLLLLFTLSYTTYSPSRTYTHHVPIWAGIKGRPMCVKMHTMPAC